MAFVAFQGEKGAFSERAALGFFGEKIELHPYPSFKEVFESVEAAADEDAAAVVPIENSLAGSVHQNYDLLLKHDLQIIGEIYVRVVHCLLALPGIGVEQIKSVYSHPQALQQCSEFLDNWQGIEVIPTYDTAGSAKLVVEQQLKNAAAIASEQASHDYGLQILHKGIESNHQNYTRFIILKKQAEVPERQGKTSIVISFKDIPGALFKALSGFAFRDINLLKVESRPLHGSPWKYFFYLDFDGNTRQQPINKVIAQLEEITTYLKVLGSYPMGREIE
jgi:prephenate dehydratase